MTGMGLDDAKIPKGHTQLFSVEDLHFNFRVMGFKTETSIAFGIGSEENFLEVRCQFTILN